MVGATRTTTQDFAIARLEGDEASTGCTMGTLFCPAPFTVPTDPGENDAVVTYLRPTASPACGAVTCSPEPDSVFPLGTTPVTCMASAGPSCSFAVTVEDRTAPTIMSCAADRALPAAPPEAGCSAVIPDLTGEVIATDNVTPASSLTVTQLPVAETPVSLGQPPRLVKLFVADAADNSSTCSAVVSVVDHTPPMITRCASNRTLPAFGCQAFIPDLLQRTSPSFSSPVEATDCSPITRISHDPPAGTPVAAGTMTPVTFTVEDTWGNVSTCMATVTVAGDADCDGIQDAIDQDKSTQDDESQVVSNDFVRTDFAAPATGPTFGTIVERGGWHVGIVRSGAFGVLAGINGAGTVATMQACDKPYEIRLDRSGEQAHVTCDYQITVQTPQTPFPVVVSRMRVLARALPPGSAIEVSRPGQPGWRTLLRNGTVYLGSPITADPENEDNITIEFVDASGNVIGSMELPPDQTVDLEPAVSGLIITNLGTAPLTFTLAGVTHTLHPGESTNQPPVAKARDVVVAAGATCTANAAVDDGSFDPEGDTVSLTQTPPGPYPLGATQVTLTVTDSQGASSQATATVTVMDNTPPAITNAAVDKPALWPPNHKMVEVAVNYHVTDNCSAGAGITCTLAVTSNEPVNGTGDGNTAPDWEIINAHHVRLRAERAGTGNGRLYTVTITCTDGHGNSSTQMVSVQVPKAKNKWWQWWQKQWGQERMALP